MINNDFVKRYRHAQPRHGFKQNCVNNRAENENASANRSDLRTIDLAFSFPALSFTQYCSQSLHSTRIHARSRRNFSPGTFKINILQK